LNATTPQRETRTLPVTQKKSQAREYGEALFFALILALVIRALVVQAFKIPSGSMIPTLLVGDHILVNKFIYGPRIEIPFTGTFVAKLPGFARIHRGDVVVFVYPVDRSKDFIKRVIGVEGDVMEIRKKTVFINGKRIQDSHANFEEGLTEDGVQVRDNFGPIVVPPHHIFVLGDNRDRSYDSRFWGFVDLNDIKGKAFQIYWSWDREDHWVRWNRIGRFIR
jgi:signal peptidase I